jgi:GNAT superfamily N-acetyltransferase
MHTDPIREVVLVATVPASEGEVIIGAGRYVAPAAPAPVHSADVAFVVEEDYHGQGLASALLRHLVEVARDRGFACLEADVLAENPSMLKVFARSGLPLRKHLEAGSLHIWMDLAAA